jgi:hypothetical protein
MLYTLVLLLGAVALGVYLSKNMDVWAKPVFYTVVVVVSFGLVLIGIGLVASVAYWFTSMVPAW